MVAILLMPPTLWSQSTAEALYRGFDRNLVYSDRQGAGKVNGIVDVSHSRIGIVAIPNSNPTVHLLSSPRDFRVGLDFSVLDNGGGATPLRLKIWSPRKAATYSIEFGAPPRNVVTASATTGGKTVMSETLGTYLPGARYHLDLAVDRSAGLLTANVSTQDALPAEGPSVLMTGGPGEPGYTELDSAYIPVLAGRQYDFGANLLLSSGLDNYKIVLDWFDRTKKRLSTSNDWRPVSELNGWTRKVFVGSAPPGAAFAQMVVGAGGGRTKILVNDPFLTDASALGANLIRESHFTKGLSGWQVVGGKDLFQRPQVVAPSSRTMASHLSASELPDLFLALPAAVTASVEAQAANSTVVLQNYSIRLPAASGPALKLDDERVHALLRILALLALMIVLGLLLSKLITGAIRAWSARHRLRLSGRSIRVPQAALPIAVLLLVGFVIGNIVVFHIGAHPYDMMAEKTFAYVGGAYGPSDLFYLPALTTPAKIWGGAPFADVSFPYGPGFAVIFGALGWIHQTFLSDPLLPQLDAFSLEFAIKLLSVVCGLIDGLLIYGILRRLRVSQRNSILAAGLFLFNPAVWFMMSIWGETQTVSLTFLLGAIWFAEIDSPWAAWLSLTFCAITRPQMLVPAALLALVFLTRFSWKRSIVAISIAVVGIYLALAPISLQTGPSLLASYVANTLHGQTNAEPGAGEYFYVSYDGYNIWPLATLLVSGQTGHSRIYFPQAAPLHGQLSYASAGNLAVLIGLGVLTAILALRRIRKRWRFGDYLPIVTAAIFVLLVFKTGVSSHHFVIALALLLICRGFLRESVFYICSAALSLTTLVSMYGSLGFGLSGAPFMAPQLAGSEVTRFFMGAFVNDGFISFAVVSNLVILLVVVAATFGVVFRAFAQTSGLVPLESAVKEARVQEASVI
jgi:hypothetical protein